MSMYQAGTDGPIDTRHLSDDRAEAAAMSAGLRAATARKDEALADDVVHPAHYTNERFGGIECWDFARHFPYLTGNAVKYIWRHEDKADPIKDLRKSLQYLDEFGGGDDAGRYAVLPGHEAHVDSLLARMAGYLDARDTPDVYLALRSIAKGRINEARSFVADELKWREIKRDEAAAEAAEIAEANGGLAEAAPRRFVESGGVLGLIGSIVTVPGSLFKSRVKVAATGRLAEITAITPSGATYTLVHEGPGGEGATRVSVAHGALVELVHAAVDQ